MWRSPEETVVDGTGGPPPPADIGVTRRAHRRRRRRSTSPRATTLDATGLVVAPGFVDPHTHYDAQLLGPARHAVELARRHHA